jgi:hypothetical protein
MLYGMELIIPKATPLIQLELQYRYVFNLYKPAATLIWFGYELPSSQVLFYAIIRLITDVVEQHD